MRRRRERMLDKEGEGARQLGGRKLRGGKYVYVWREWET